MSVSEPDDTLTAPEESARDHDALQPGARVGRYRIDRPLGAGGQGVVLLATDPELDRRVAIKLLHSRDPRLTTRLLREGRALARVEHPAVVRVFDVGEHDGRVFLAMEFFDGEDLASHWASARLGPHARVATIVAAGRGLAAVHAAELVHRDFKPKNVLVDRSGRVAVTDFGLVRTLDDAATDPNTRTDPRVRVGTPGYMAPEQLVRADVDARADQFAFCVALYEAWYGVRPFGGHDVAELIGAMIGRVARPPAGARKAPQWLRRVLERGLDPDPRARFASMDELLDALDRRGARTRGLVLVVAAIVLALAFVLVRPQRATPSKPARVGEAMAAVQSPRSAWTRARIEAAILPAHEVLVKGDAQRGRAFAAALVGSAEARGDGTLANAAALVRGRAEVALGDRAAGRHTLETVLATARASGDDATYANAAIELCDQEMSEGRLASADQWLREVEAAVMRGNLSLATISGLELRHAVIASRRGELDVAESSYYLLLDLSGTAREDDRFRASMHNNLAAIHDAEPGNPNMIAEFERALALYESAGVKSSNVARTEANLGLALIAAGQHERGLACVRSAREQTDPADAMSRAQAELALANAYRFAGDLHACVNQARATHELATRVHADPHTIVDAQQLESDCRLLLGDAKAAEAIAAAAVTALDGNDLADDVAARARFTYARAAWLGGEAATARREAARALVEARDPGLAGQIAGWLARPTAPVPPARDPPR